MNNSIRTQNLPATLIRQIISGLRLDQASDRETSCIAAQEAARDFQQSVADVPSYL